MFCSSGVAFFRFFGGWVVFLGRWFGERGVFRCGLWGPRWWGVESGVVCGGLVGVGLVGREMGDILAEAGGLEDGVVWVVKGLGICRCGGR